MFKDLFTFEKLVEYTEDLWIFEGVIFLQKFGPYEIDDGVPFIEFNYESGTVTTYDKDGSTVIHTFPFKIVAA